MRDFLAWYMFRGFAQRDRMRFAEEPSDRSEPLEPLKLASEEPAESEPEPS